MVGGIHPPLEVTANWPTPNYVNPETRGHGAVILCAILSSFSIFTVALRLWTRAKVTNNFGVDDWFMIAAMPVVVGLAIAICLASTVYYYDRHVWDVPMPHGAIATRQVSFTIELLYIWAVGPIKISIILFYKRLSNGIVSKSVVWVLWGTAAFVVAYMVTFTVTLFLSCQPFAAYWYQVDPFWTASNQYTCTHEGANLIAASIMSVVQDFLVAGLPTVMFARMDIPVRQKLAMTLVFAVGFFLCITGILRIVYINKIFNETWDVTWYAYDAWCWTAIEVFMGAVVASVPALKIFIQRHLESMTPSYCYGYSESYHTRSSRPSPPTNMNRLPARISHRFSNGACAWSRTLSDSEIAHHDAWVDSYKDIVLPLEHVREREIKHPIEVTRSITTLNTPDHQQLVDVNDGRYWHARARSQFDGLKRHPTGSSSYTASPISPIRAFDTAHMDTPDDTGEPGSAQRTTTIIPASLQVAAVAEASPALTLMRMPFLF